jgi:hypothetical protein
MSIDPALHHIMNYLLDGHLSRIEDENKRLREELTQRQGPSGMLEEQVADWLRGQGYTVEKKS